MNTPAKKVADGWDACSAVQAKAYLLHEAAAALLQAQTKGTPGDRAVRLRSRATVCIARVSNIGKNMRTIDAEGTEESFRRFIRTTFDLKPAEVDAVVERVKFDARTLRGQLDLFEKPSAP